MNPRATILMSALAFGLLACNTPPNDSTPSPPTPPTSPPVGSPVPPDPGSSMISEVAPQSQLLAVRSKTVSFAVRTREPAVVRADTIGKALVDMNLNAQSSGNGLTHTFTINLQPGQPYTLPGQDRIAQ